MWLVVGPLRFIKSKVSVAMYQEILEHAILPCADKLYGDPYLLFQEDLALAYSAETTTKTFADHTITLLNWPGNSPDLSPQRIYGLLSTDLT